MLEEGVCARLDNKGTLRVCLRASLLTWCLSSPLHLLGLTIPSVIMVSGKDPLDDRTIKEKIIGE